MVGVRKSVSLGARFCIAVLTRVLAWNITQVHQHVRGFRLYDIVGRPVRNALTISSRTTSRFTHGSISHPQCIAKRIQTLILDSWRCPYAIRMVILVIAERARHCDVIDSDSGSLASPPRWAFLFPISCSLMIKLDHDGMIEGRCGLFPET